MLRDTKRRGNVGIDLGRLTGALDDRLATADADLAHRFPGDRGGRQPVHTVYVPADRYRADTVPAWGHAALDAVTANADIFAEIVGDDDVVGRVRAKLADEPIEDLRIDLEDGYGRRPDDDEDRDAVAAATALARSQTDGTAPPFAGLRVKSLEAPTRARGVRTLVLFLDALLEGGGTPGVVTLPKVTSVDQVEAMVYLLGELEDALGITGLRFEIQIETPQSVLGPDGTALVARMIHAADGRCTGLHYGTYDYSAFCGIAAEYQSMAHPVADHAKLIMQAAAAGTGVRLSDGSTNVLPIGEQVERGWRLHYELVGRSLERGYYQGWDLHPAQLATRFAATFAFYRAGFAAAARRLRDYTSGTGSAVLDEPATARALADFVLRGLQAGAIDDTEASAATGVNADELARLARPGR
jgi:citrate lyase beta subunit